MFLSSFPDLDNLLGILCEFLNFVDTNLKHTTPNLQEWRWESQFIIIIIRPHYTLCHLFIGCMKLWQPLLREVNKKCHHSWITCQSFSCCPKLLHSGSTLLAFKLKNYKIYTFYRTFCMYVIIKGNNIIGCIVTLAANIYEFVIVCIHY